MLEILASCFLWNIIFVTFFVKQQVNQLISHIHSFFIPGWNINNRENQQQGANFYCVHQYDIFPKLR